jgi:hypothetical protein
MFEAVADTLGLDFNVFPVGSKRFRNIEFIGVDNKPITFQETRRARRALTTDDFAFGVTFTISPPIDLGDKTAESLAVLLQLGGFNFYYNNGSTATYLEAGANLQYSIFDPNPSSTIATITITGTGNTTTTTSSSTFGVSNTIALIVGLCAAVLLILLIIAVIYTRRNHSAASQKITSLTSRKFVRVMAPAKTVWDPANMGDWWTVSPTGEKPFHFFPSLWDPDNVEDWWTMSEMSNDPMENMGYKNNPKFLDGPDAAAVGTPYFDPYAEYGGSPETLEGFWSSN